MANTELLPMHPDFAPWYASVNLGDDETRRQSRWAGVTAAVNSADSKDIEALIRLAFKSRQAAATAQVMKIREAFKTADETFEMHGNDRELQVLASAVLAALMNVGGDAGAVTALAITTASMDGARKPDLPMDLRVLAEGAINEIAEKNRQRPNLLTHTSVEPPKFNFDKSVEKIKAEPNWESVGQAFTMAFDSTRTAFVQIARRQANAVTALNTFLRVQDEELQMLWWLTGQRSFDLDCTFDAISTDALPLVLGKELADSTVLTPGPASVKALLSRAGLKDRKKIALPTAINAAEPAWLQKFMPEGDPSPVSTPIHYGIKRQLETGAGDTWIAGWSAAVGATGSFAMTPLTLGNLFYRERLLLLIGNV